jgi:hypothetical protein
VDIAAARDGLAAFGLVLVATGAPMGALKRVGRSRGARLADRMHGVLRVVQAYAGPALCAYHATSLLAAGDALGAIVVLLPLVAFALAAGCMVGLRLRVRRALGQADPSWGTVARSSLLYPATLVAVLAVPALHDNPLVRVLNAPIVGLDAGGALGAAAAWVLVLVALGSAYGAVAAAVGALFVRPRTGDIPTSQ